MPLGELPTSPNENMPDSFHEDPKQERDLRRMEYFVVCFLMIALVIIIACIGVWVLFGCLDGIHYRLVQTLAAIDNHWRITLLIPILLFFRPIRRFLLRVRKVAGAEIGEQIQPKGSGPGGHT